MRLWFLTAAPSTGLRALALLAGALASVAATATTPGKAHSQATPPVTTSAAADSSWFEAPLQRAQELLNAGKPAAAESAARELLAEVERREGADSKPTARVLAVLVSSLRRGAKVNDSEALELAKRALAVRERVYGLDHVAVAVALIDLGNVHFERGEYADALSLTARAVALREKHLPPNDRLIGEVLTNLGAFRFMAGDLKGAREPLERALAITEHNLGPEHRNVADCLENLAGVCSAIGEPRAAAGFAERAVPIVEKAFGRDHPRYAQSLMNLGSLYSEMGDLERALELDDRALAILETAADADPLLMILTRGNRAQALRRMGRYAEARHTVEQLLPSAEQLLGPDHPDVARIHLEFGALLLTTGDFVAGDVHLQRARAITAKVEGEQSAGYAYQSVSQSAALIRLGRLEEAESVLLQAVATLDSAGASDRMFALALNNLADVRVRLGRPEAAVPVAQRAERMARISSPREGSQVGLTLSTLGLALLDQGDLAGARAAHEQALAIRRRELGEQHPETAFSMFQMALTLADQGDANAALELALQCEQAGRAHVRLTARALSEREALLYAGDRPRGVDLALSLLARGVLSSADVARVWDEAAQSRGLVLDEMAQRNHAAHSAGAAGLAALELDFAAQQQVLARMMIRDADGGDISARVAQARADLERAERALADASAAFRAQLQQDGQRLSHWLQQRSAGHALVAFARFDDPLAALAQRRSRARGERGAQGAPERGVSETAAAPASYIAFVQPAGAGPAVAVSVGSADEVDALVAKWREQMSGATLAAGAPGDARAGDAAAMAAGQALRARVWEPVAGLLDAASTVLIVPDGQLQLVDFAALPGADGSYLVERGPTLHFLSAERDLQAPPASPGTNAVGLLALGDPDFDTVPRPRKASDSPIVVAAVSGASLSGAGFRGQRPACGDFNAIRWRRLPQTARELQDIGTLWRQRTARDGVPSSLEARLLTGREAGEAALKALAPGRRVVHVATHGFVLDGACGPSEVATRGMGGYVVGASDTLAAAGTPGTATPGTATPAAAAPPAVGASRSDNPLQLCGLVLAGANRRDATDPDQEDGIVTAEEIAALDLSSVEWAVLSACETGVGASRAGEGVFGMRRAFRVAGAHTVITSLWPVQDRAAREWMHALYEARWAQGLTTAEAVRHAARSQLAARRARGESTHPRYWAGFIAAGQWR